MAVTLGQLATALRITTDPTDTVPEPENGILTRIQAWATDEIVGRAPAAPDNAKDSALIVLAGYVFDRPISERGTAFANAWENSGASDMLRRYIQRRAFILDSDTPTSTTTVTPGGGGGVDTAAVSAIIDNEVEGWAQIGDATAIPHEKLVNATAAATDQTARDAATAAQEAAGQANQNLVDQEGVKEIVDQDVESWARTENADEKIPASKLPEPSAAPSSGRPSTVLHENVRLPAPDRAMRIGWNQSRAITAAVFTRAGQHPTDGAVQGMTMGLDVPPAPPALAGDPTLYLAVWLAGDGDDGTEIRLGVDDATDSFGMPMHLVVNGVVGHYHVTRERLTHDTSRRLSVQIPGDMILGESDVAPWALADNADTIPDDKLPPAPSGGGGGGLTITELANITTNSTSGSDRVFTASAAQNLAIKTARDAGSFKALKVRIGVDSGSGVHVHHDSPDILMNETSFGSGFQLREFNWSTHESNSAKFCQLDIQEIGASFTVKVVINPSSTPTNTPSGPNGTCRIWGVA